MRRERREAGTSECGPCSSGRFGLLYRGKEQVSFVCNAVRARQIICMCVETRLRKLHTGSGHTVGDKDIHPDAALRPCPGLLTEETGTRTCSNVS